MKRTNKWLVVGSLAAAVLLSLSAKSYAQDAPAAAGGTAANGAAGGNGDYGYKFEDDPLAAGLEGCTEPEP